MLALTLALLPLIAARKSQTFAPPGNGPLEQSGNYTGASNGSLPLQGVVPGKGESPPARIATDPSVRPVHHDLAREHGL